MKRINGIARATPGPTAGSRSNVVESRKAEGKLRAECERLRQLVEELDEQHKRDRRLIATLQSERDEYLRVVCAYLRKDSKIEDWHDFNEEEYTLSAEEVLAELGKRKGP